MKHVVHSEINGGMMYKLRDETSRLVLLVNPSYGISWPEFPAGVYFWLCTRSVSGRESCS